MWHAGRNQALRADLWEPCKIREDKALAEKTQQQVDFSETFREKVRLKSHKSDLQLKLQKTARWSQNEENKETKNRGNLP